MRLCRCIELNTIRIHLFNQCPPIGSDLPFIVSEINVENRLLRINRLRFDDLASPRETIDEFREGTLIGVERLRTLTGIVEMRYGKIACEGAVEG